MFCFAQLGVRTESIPTTAKNRSLLFFFSCPVKRYLTECEQQKKLKIKNRTLEKER
jgi:hypothetical protein